MTTAPSKPFTTSASSSSTADCASFSSRVPAGGEDPSNLRFRAPVGGGRMPTVDATIEKLILDLADVDRREHALAQLSVRREIFQDLAPKLWFSFGTISILLKEVVSAYPLLSPPTLTLAQSNRVSDVLALLQCVASHPDTRGVFVQACIPLYLYPFLETTCKMNQFDFLRLNSLGVIGALVKVPDTQIIIFLLSSEVMPFCLRALEHGSEMSKTVATFILQRILLDDVGLEYVCSVSERLFAVNKALADVVAALVEKPSVRLLKNIIRCYLRLSVNERSLWVLRYTLPRRLTDSKLCHYLWEDQTAILSLQLLLENVQRAPNA